MAKKYADIRIDLTVEFQDEGFDDLKDQAIEAAIDKLLISKHDVVGIEVIGEVRDTELPAQKTTHPSGGDRHGE
ncbi:hypothetical protein [Brucella intermedia]|uniref:hypothetical protein n=1 Tax=Brucella intermedia TaxID=94625 RepID=UPI00224B499D|nr:hypothetical protein [Brucella intermedia]